jgi:hypothetical protein
MTKTAHARAVAVSDESLRSWELRSNSGDPAFVFDFFDSGEPIQYAKALAVAQKFAYRELRAQAEQFSIHGRKRRTLNQGQFVIALDRKALALDRETRIICGYHPEAYLLDEDGAVTWVEETEMAPVGLLSKFLETFKDLQPHTHQSVDVKGGLQVGVGYMKPVDYTQPPPVIPPLPPVPQIEATDAEFSEVDPELEYLLGPEPVPAPVSITIAPVINIVADEAAATMFDDQDIVEDFSQPMSGDNKLSPEPERVIRDTPTAAETPSKQEGVLAPPARSIPPSWRAEWEKLQARGAALPDKLDRAR